MGNPHWTEDTDKQCYNAAKSYQIAHQGAWYSKEYVKDLDPGNEPYWSGRLIGVAEYDKISDGDTVLLKIETGSRDDFFLAFNRKIGANADNKMASDRVTIIEAGDNGVGFSQVSLDRRRYCSLCCMHHFISTCYSFNTLQSWLVDWLNEGEEYVFNNFLNDEPLTVKVNKIDIQVAPGYAEVELIYRTTPTPNPTSAPTCGNGEMMKVTILTDNYPGETTWELVDTCNNNQVIMTGGPYDNQGTKYVAEGCVPEAMYEFSIKVRSYRVLHHL